MQFYIICNFIILLLFPCFAYSGGYVGTYCSRDEALDALPESSSTIGDCSSIAGDGACYDGCVNARILEDGEWVYYHAIYYTGGEGCEECDPGNDELTAAVNVTVAGPGYVSGEGCNSPLKCPNTCNAISVNGPCTVSLTAHPNMSDLDVEINASSHCSVSGNNVTCVVAIGETATVEVYFEDVCTTDSDGDGIYNYADFNKDDPTVNAKVGFKVGALSATADTNIFPMYETVVDFFMGVGVGSDVEQKVSQYLYDDNFLKKTYFVFADKDSGMEYGVGNPDVMTETLYHKIECDPRFQYCGEYTNSELQGYIPCNKSYPLDPVHDYIIPPSEVPELNNDVPDGVYDTPDSACSCFETVNKNTAATVDTLKNIQELEKALVENTGITVNKLNATNELLTKILNKSQYDSFTQEDINDLVESMNDDAEESEDDGGGIEATKNDEINQDLASYDDSSNDQLEDLIEDEKQGYTDDIESYNDDLNSFVSGKFHVSVSDPSCSFTAPVFGSNVTFDGCGYASVLSTMGAFIKFMSYLTGIIIILRA